MFVDLRNTFDEIEHNARRKCPECILSPRYECDHLQGDKAGSRFKSYRFASESTISFFKASNSSRKPHFSINQFVSRSISIFLNKFVSNLGKDLKNLSDSKIVGSKRASHFVGDHSHIRLWMFGKRSLKQNNPEGKSFFEPPSLLGGLGIGGSSGSFFSP